MTAGTDSDQTPKGRETPSNRKPRNVQPTARAETRSFTAPERLLILDIWERSELSAPRFGELLGITSHTLYQWRRRDAQSSVRRRHPALHQGIAGLHPN